MDKLKISILSFLFCFLLVFINLNHVNAESFKENEIKNLILEEKEKLEYENQCHVIEYIWNVLTGKDVSSMKKGRETNGSITITCPNCNNSIILTIKTIGNTSNYNNYNNNYNNYNNNQNNIQNRSNNNGWGGWGDLNSPGFGILPNNNSNNNQNNIQNDIHNFHNFKINEESEIKENMKDIEENLNRNIKKDNEKIVTCMKN